MTKNELEDVLHVLGLDYEAEADQVYVFYVLPDGRVDNFSVNVRRGVGMSDTALLDLMRHEYPASREGKVLAVERPTGIRLHEDKAAEEWLDTYEVCKKMHISRATLYRWMQRGLFMGSRLGNKVYFRVSDIERALAENVVQENGRIDRQCLK